METKQVMRLGSDYVIPLDIRIISASNADIIAAVQTGSFRRDLFFRINTLRLSLPSLNDRPDDVLYLFSYFLQSFSHRQVSLPKIVNVLPPIEAGASCFNENSATDSKELRRLTLSPQA
ncbi:MULTISPECIES: sigma 54-interacting transcriptional regulator [Megasphaera]|nr:MULTISPECIES: sigma 54-interacting transcriptional regulator [Megasphaera]